MKITLLFLTLFGSAFADPTDEYLEAVTKLQAQYDASLTKGGDKEKLDKILEQEKQKLREKFEETKVTTRKVTVDSKSETGERIGSYSIGETITLQYVSGEWSAYVGWKLESPDSASVVQHKVALIFRSIRGEDTVVATPQGTENTPFQYVVEAKGTYYLKMNDPLAASNEGKVTYNVGVIKVKN